jgi:hypothetical protein
MYINNYLSLTKEVFLSDKEKLSYVLSRFGGLYIVALENQGPYSSR